jgi:hypothetical protein
MLEALRSRIHRSRRSRFQELPLESYQIYPEGRLLEPAFIAEPRNSGVTLSSTTPVASMGSCFAREIKEFLVARGYRYLQTEHNRWSVHASCSWERVYSAANASQIFDYTVHRELDPARLHPCGESCVDLLRNKVGYPDPSTAESDVRSHIEASRRAIEECELFILTLGQNELFRSRRRGFYFAGRPPEDLVSSGEAELSRLSVEENCDHLERLYSRFREMNPRGRLLLTLSPIPSLATFFDENVVVRSNWNKAILRVAIGLFLERHSEVLYFPSYEIVQTWRGNAYLSDNRHVRRPVVEAIMRAFLSTYGGRG